METGMLHAASRGAAVLAGASGAGLPLPLPLPLPRPLPGVAAPVPEGLAPLLLATTLTPPAPPTH